jgi:hypothetical protein
MRDGEAEDRVCQSCAASERNKKRYLSGQAHPQWRGGRAKTGDGYVKVHLPPTDLFHPMCVRGHNYVLEHRLVMARHLGRCLTPFDEVHHKNGVRDDNGLENLELTSKGAHTIAHSKGYRDGFVKGLADGRGQAIASLQARVTALEAEVALLRGSIQEAEIYNKET